MPTVSFDVLLDEMKHDPDFAATYEKENSRLDAAASLMRAQSKSEPPQEESSD